MPGRGRGRCRQGRGTCRDQNRENNYKVDRTSIKSLKSFEGISILYPPNSTSHDATKNGVQIVKEKLTRYLGRGYGRFGRFIADDEYFVEPIPDPPDDPLDPNNQNSVIQWKVYESAMTEVAKRAMKTNNDKVSWFSVIQSVLSQESEDLVQAEDDWEEVELEQDQLELWRLVERTHLTRVTGSTVLDQDNAMTEYNKVRQHDRNESIQEYKKRHERAVDALVRVGHPQVPDEQMQVIKWIRGLNKKHREWKLKILNAMQAGEDPPASLEDAVQLCRNYVPVNDNRDDRGLDGAPSTVFAALAALKDKHDKDQATDNDRKEQKIALKAAGKAGKRGDASAAGGKKKKAVDSDEEEETASEKGHGRMSCWTCGQPGHTTASCPLKDRIHDLVREGKLFHVRVCLHDSNGKPLLGPYDVLLDDEANVSVF